MKQKIKVFQFQQKAFDSEGNIIPRDKRKTKVVCIGIVIVPKNKKDFEEVIWDLFNWTCWNWGKLHGKSWIYGIRNGVRRDGFRMFPTHNAKGFCNSDIFFKLGDKWMIAKSFGWGEANSYEEALNIVIEQQRF